MGIDTAQRRASAAAAPSTDGVAGLDKPQRWQVAGLYSAFGDTSNPIGDDLARASVARTLLPDGMVALSQAERAAATGLYRGFFAETAPSGGVDTAPKRASVARTSLLDGVAGLGISDRQHITGLYRGPLTAGGGPPPTPTPDPVFPMPQGGGGAGMPGDFRLSGRKPKFPPMLADIIGRFYDELHRQPAPVARAVSERIEAAVAELPVDVTADLAALQNFLAVLQSLRDMLAQWEYLQREEDDLAVLLLSGSI